MSGPFEVVFVDGPLKGQVAEVESPTITYPVIGKERITYRVHQFGFNSGGEAIVLHLAYCSPLEPSVGDVAEAILKPEVFRSAVVWRPWGT